MSDDPGHALAVRMAELARQVATPRSVEEVLAGVTAAALEIIPGVSAARFDYASLDQQRGLLFIAHLGASEVVEVDIHAKPGGADHPESVASARGSCRTCP